MSSATASGREGGCRSTGAGRITHEVLLASGTMDREREGRGAPDWRRSSDNPRSEAAPEPPVAGGVRMERDPRRIGKEE